MNISMIDYIFLFGYKNFIDQKLIKVKCHTILVCVFFFFASTYKSLKNSTSLKGVDRRNIFGMSNSRGD